MAAPARGGAAACIDLPALRRLLRDIDPALGAAGQLQRLVDAAADRLPLPGGGDTLTRWQALAAVAEHDLSLAKLYEGHTDALAILAEVGAPPHLRDPALTWGVWAAEAPQGRAIVDVDVDGSGAGARLSGAKCWCSGAATATHGLLTAWRPDGTGPQLVAVALSQPAVQVDGSAWQALGMAGSASVDVRFAGAAATLVGRPGQYLDRPGFWQGGAGIAACWYGGALGIARALRRAAVMPQGAAANEFRRAALGKVDLALRRTAALLREAARWIDDHPAQDAQAVALRVRLAAEQCAMTVLDETGRSLGAAPFCRDAAFARRAADLPVFIRQSHAERDFAALGSAVAATGEPGTEADEWQL